MAKYKVIFRSDNKNADTAPGWEPGCPVIINAVQVSRNTETGQCYLQLKLSNLTNEVVGRFALRAEVTYADGTAEAVEIAPLDADIRPGRAHQPDAVPLTGSDVRHVTARIASATYGNEQWMSAGKVCANTAGGPLDLDQTATAERNRLLADLGKNPEKYRHHMVQGGDWWICSCGMPNVGKDQCICGLARKAVEQLEDESYLNAAAAEREATEKKTRAKRKRRRIITTVAAIIALIIAVVAIPAGVRTAQENEYGQAYQAAVELQESGNYIIAYERFSDMADYKDAGDRARECARLAADRATEEGDLEKAALWYEKASESALSEEAEQREAEAVRQQIDNDPLLGPMVDRYITATGFTDNGHFKKGNFDLGEHFSLHLASDGTCSLSYNDEDTHDTYTGTWTTADTDLFVLNLPEFGGSWTATETTLVQEILLTNDSDENRQFTFSVTDEHLYD